MGRTVVANVRIAVASGSRGGAAFTIVGLPYTNHGTLDGGGFIIYNNNFHSSDEFYPFINANTSTISFYEQNGTAVNANELDADNYDIRLGLVYQTT